MKTQIFRFLFVLFVTGLTLSGWGIYREMRPNLEAEKHYKVLQEQIVIPDIPLGADADTEFQEEQVIDFDELQKSIPDLVAWIYGPGTAIHYPVVQGIDNEYYLEHLADLAKNRNGAIFMDYRNSADFSDFLSILYGHHIRGGRMFSSLENYRTQEYYEEHPVLYLFTRQSSYEIRLFAGVVMDADSEFFPLGINSEDRDEWLSDLRQRSSFNADLEPDPNGRFIALCTCTYEYSNARYVVYGQIEES